MVRSCKRRNQFVNIYEGNCNEIVKDLPPIHCVITSPPYFQKRQYGRSENEIGNEKDVNEYIDKLVGMFNSIPLHTRGSIWVNIGDKRNKHGGLWMVPERFALQMMNNGWHLIDNVVWAKVLDDNDGTVEGVCMIEPAERRLNGNGWEVFYRFVRNPKDCYCDSCAVRIPRDNCDVQPYLTKPLMNVVTSVDGRACQNVWRVPMGQTRYKHYAVFPEELVERPVAMTCPMRTSPDGSVLVERVIKMVEYDEGKGRKRQFGKYKSLEGEYDGDVSRQITGRVDTGRSYVPRKPNTLGWTPEMPEYAAGTVLDPFCGTGTTGAVALRLGRSFVGIDLYSEFCDIAYERCTSVFEMFDKHNLDPWTSHK